MDASFWHQRWEEGRIGFHQASASPLLARHWPALGLPEGSRVFVPLCGKSLDMVWLAEQGHAVFGVELSTLAVAQFFAERGLEPSVRESPAGVHYRGGPYELLCGDAFALGAELLADCAGAYDRAALVALPPETRALYADTCWRRLPPHCRGLLVTMEYPQAERAGPPFSVEAPEVDLLFGAEWSPELLERRDILDREPGFAADGVSALSTCAWRLQRPG